MRYRVECSRCHRMILIDVTKRLSELERRCFTCHGCELEVKGQEL